MIDPKIDEQVDEILQLVENGKIKGTENKMKQLLMKYPNYHSVLYGMGTILVHQYQLQN